MAAIFRTRPLWGCPRNPFWPPWWSHTWPKVLFKGSENSVWKRQQEWVYVYIWSNPTKVRGPPTLFGGPTSKHSPLNSPFWNCLSSDEPARTTSVYSGGPRNIGLVLSFQGGKSQIIRPATPSTYICCDVRTLPLHAPYTTQFSFPHESNWLRWGPGPERFACLSTKLPSVPNHWSKLDWATYIHFYNQIKIPSQLKKLGPSSWKVIKIIGWIGSWVTVT